MNRLYWLSLSILGVWRITHLLSAEDGRADCWRSFANWPGPDFGKLLDCFYCLSVWVKCSIRVSSEADGADECCCGRLSGGAILLNRLTAPAVQYSEDPPIGKGDGLWCCGQSRSFMVNAQAAPGGVVPAWDGPALPLLGRDRRRSWSLKVSARVVVDSRDRASTGAIPVLRQVGR